MTNADVGVLPVAETWYQASTAGSAITMIREPHVHPFLQANIWHVRGRDRDLFIDCGLGVTPLRPAFPALFTRDPLLVLTHAHLDHMGGAGEFEQCLAHEDEPAERPLAQTLLGGQLAATFRLDEPLPPVLLTAVPHRGYDPASYRLHRARVSARVRQGDVIDLGNRAFTVLHLPGHSPGSIALFDEHDGTLFAGDAVYDGPLLDELPGSCRDDYLTSMSRLRGMPVRVVHAGHDASFDRTRLHQLIDAYVASRAVSPAPLAGRASHRHGAVIRQVVVGGGERDRGGVRAHPVQRGGAGSAGGDQRHDQLVEPGELVIEVLGTAAEFAQGQEGVVADDAARAGAQRGQLGD